MAAGPVARPQSRALARVASLPALALADDLIVLLGGSTGIACVVGAVERLDERRGPMIGGHC